MKYFVVLSELINNLKHHLEDPPIYDLDGKPLSIEIKDFLTIQEISPLQVPIFYIGTLRFTGSAIETDQGCLKVPFRVEIDTILIHFFQDDEVLRNLTFDLADKIVQRIDTFEDEKILDKEISFEVKYSKIKDGAFGSVFMSIRFQLNLSSVLT